MGIFTKEETRALAISVLVLGIVFGLNDKNGTFDIAYWLLNFLRVIVIVTIITVLREYIRKIIARGFHAETRYDVWKIKRFGFGKRAKLRMNLWLGVVLPLLISIFSFGKLYFPAVGIFDVKENVSKRIGKRFTKLTEFETAVIALSGVLVNIFLALILGIFNKFIDFGQFINVNMWIALFSFLPFGDLDGAKIFFGSILLYVLSLAFTIFVFILINFLGIISTVILSLIFALIITIIYFKIFEYK